MIKQDLPKDNPTLNEAIKLVEFIYDEVLTQFGEFNEEKYNTESKIRRAANDIIFYVSQAVGNRTLDTSEYDWSIARKNLIAIKTMYVFAEKRFIEFEPSIVVRIDKLVSEIDKEIDKSKSEVKYKIEEELDHWRKKYNIWKEMSEDKPKSSK
jgi:hypothetical protein